MARRAIYYQSRFNDADFNLFLDAGGFGRGFGDLSIIYNDYLLTAMSKLGFHIFNLSYRDYINGGQILKDLKKKHDIEFLSSNTFYKESGKRFTEPYLIKTIKAQHKVDFPALSKLTVGIIGLLDEQVKLFGGTIDEPMLESRPPLEIAQELVPQIRDKVDLVILMYNGNYEKFKEILNTVHGIDAALLGGQYFMVNNRDKFDAVIATTPSQGKYADIFRLILNGEKKIVSTEKDHEPLDENIHEDPAIAKIVTELENAEKEFYKTQAENN